MGIKAYEDALDGGICEELIELYERSDSKLPAHEYNGLPPNAERKGMVVIIPKSGWEGELRELILEKARHYIFQFGAEHAGLQVMVSEPYLLTNPRIEKIDIGEGFDWHMDARQHQSDRRFLTLLFYLNDQEEGGETTFFYQGESIKPKQGTLALFPPFWTHIHKGGTPKLLPKYTVGLFATLE
ncbi:MAG: 2OG-Fe(II) oxygenase [Candidatus Thiosymbion ectosymbiont of Robbea hypermnestra]|nr:2OG-Fe(II) oxygenase [Candidatus Thiosymbion ectosymbiont of Robbea hypermnestra]